MTKLSYATLILCGLSAFALPLVSGAPAEDQATVTVKVGTSYPGIETMPIYVGRQNGYFAAEHMTIDLTSLATGDKISYALLGGAIDIARYTPDWIIRAIEKGGSKLKIVLGSANSLTFSLLAPNSIASYADLKGKRIGVSTVAAADASVVIKMLAAHSLNKGDYSLIQAGSSPERAAALRAGSLSATLITPPFDQRVLDEGGFKRLDWSTDVIPHYAWGAEAIREDWAHANEATLVAYMRAWIKAWRYIHNPANKEAVIAILARESKIDDRYARNMYDLYYGPNAIGVEIDGKLDLVGYQVMLNDMVERGMIDPPPPTPDKYVDSSFWEKAEASLR